MGMKQEWAEIIIAEFFRRKKPNEKTLQNINRKICGAFGHAMIPNTDLMNTYRRLVEKGALKPNKDFERILLVRKIRTQSGVAAIAVLTKPYPCPGTCAYCPSQKEMPKSYLSNEPAVMRAIANKFDPFKQTDMRLKALAINGHATDKIEIIVMGGTWTYFPEKYQTWYIKRVFDALNGVTSKTLAAAQKRNETAPHRCVGLTLETRPDYITPTEIKRMRKLGCTRVEIGVQHIDDDILQLNKRGHLRKEIVDATRLLKDAGFKICYHLMPNLPGSTPKRDLKIFKELFSNPDFQPDMIKIYPCVVVKGSELYTWWQEGKYKPYSDKVLTKLLLDIKKALPDYVRVIRLIRDIPAESIEAGNLTSNLRELLQRELNQQGLYCKCIRCREIGHQKNSNKLDVVLKTEKYEASNGAEYFIQYASSDEKALYAFVRLRLPAQNATDIKELQGAALIRELHTYGHMVPLANKDKSARQHTGLGMKLMREAEKIAKKEGYKKIAVISGIGVRAYYANKLGYALEGTYMVKNLTAKKSAA